MKTDRELLELAAKAAGIENAIVYDACPEDGFPTAYVKTSKRTYWNPLADDGDALRLAVRLRIDMNFDMPDPFCVSVFWPGAPSWKFEQATMGYSIEEATRRAIVLAASELATKEAK